MRLYENGKLKKESVFMLIRECLLDQRSKNDVELAECLLSKIQLLGLNVKKVFVYGFPVKVRIAGKEVVFNAKESKKIVATLQHNRLSTHKNSTLNELIGEDEEIPF
jgi:hypothetical protein